MSRRSKDKPLPTIWHVPDQLWYRIEVILLELDPPYDTGAKRIDQRAALDAIIYRLRTGVQWNHLPKEFPDDSSVHRTMQRWIKKGVFQAIWAELVEVCDDLGGVNFSWQAADGCLGKARFGGDAIGPNPTDRGKAGVKKSLLVEAEGGPLAIVVAAANVNDAHLLEATLEAIVVARPDDEEEHLCLDKGYDNPTGRAVSKAQGYVAHIRQIGEEKLDAHHQKRYPARRYVVERTLAWLSKCRGLLVRYEKKAENYLGLLQWACALLWYRRLVRLSEPPYLR